MRYILSLSCLLGYITSSFNSTNEFVTAELKKDIYIIAPPGQPLLPQGHVYKIQRALNGFQLSPREWNIARNKLMAEECGLRQIELYKCLYIKQTPDGSCMLVSIYVDDLVIAYSDIAMLDFTFKESQDSPA